MTALHRILLVLTLLFIPVTLPSDRITSEQEVDVWVAGAASGLGFNLTVWEVESIASKLGDIILDPTRKLSSGDEILLVQDYVQIARRIGWLRRQVARSLSSDRGPADSTVGELEGELQVLQDMQLTRRSAVEAALEEQVSEVLADEGLTTAGLLWPPLKFRFSDPPLYLIVSPRAEIALRKGVHLKPDLSITVQQSVEDEVDSALAEHISLVEELGGFGTYPTMVLDDASLGWILDTIAHEWTHNYLAFHPLGWHYFDDSSSVTLNETVACIVGEEVGAAVSARFYAQESSPPERSSSERRPLHIPEMKPEPFDFSQEMRFTRLHVDQLLADGSVDEAELYMRERQQVFVDRGYTLRKLNQAYFAFHGSYATSPGAVDPIGPKMTRLREASPSLRDFLQTVESISRVEDLDLALAEMESR